MLTFQVKQGGVDARVAKLKPSTPWFVNQRGGLMQPTNISAQDKRDIECCVCTLIPVDAHECDRCNNLFCSDCLDDVLSKKDIKMVNFKPNMHGCDDKYHVEMKKKKVNPLVEKHVLNKL